MGEYIGAILLCLGVIVVCFWFFWWSRRERRHFIVKADDGWVVHTFTHGGSNLYERTGVPIAAGFAVGCIGAILIGSLLGAIRFVYPF